MNLSEVTASIRYALWSVFRFSGRDSRKLFWPWAIFVVLLGQLAYLVVMMPAMLGSMERAFELAQRRDVAAGAGPDPAAVAQVTAQMAVDLGRLWLPLALIHTISVAALAAAVTRRLHDRDRSVLWGLLPLPFLALGIVLMPAGVAFVVSPAQPSAAMKLLLLSSPLFWASLLWLVILLAGAGTEGPNRFGETSRETL